MMSRVRLGIVAVVIALSQSFVTSPAFAEIREVVIVGTFRTPVGALEEIIYETNAQYNGCRVSLPGLRIRMQMQIQGYAETAGWLLQDSRCAFRTKAGVIEEFDTRR